MENFAGIILNQHSQTFLLELPKVAQGTWKVFQLGIKSVFLYVELQEEVFA